MRLRTLLLDFDGVIVDSRRGVAAALNAALVEHGLEPLSEAAVLRFIGPPIHLSFETLTGTHDVDAYVETYHRIYAETCVDVVVLDGMRAALETLGAGFQLVLATSKPAPFTESILRAYGLLSLFAGTSAPTLETPSEPKAETVGRALELAAATDVVALVGDTHFDVDAGREHGLPVIGVTWGFGSETELRAAGAAAIAHDPPELVAVVQRLAGS
ncbi:MAG: phosphoglycolate phosphatase [Gaiellaceae bacterium]|jgi:phosphoglycolate phosphatase|nr:phosphoglycolate phosphatase [Gaiellaceae bacterium]